MKTVFLGIGTNKGNRERNISIALKLLSENKEINHISGVFANDIKQVMTGDLGKNVTGFLSTPELKDIFKDLKELTPNNKIQFVIF